MVVADDCFWNFDLEVVIGLPCFACDAVDYFDYGWRKSAFVDFVGFVLGYWRVCSRDLSVCPLLLLNAFFVVRSFCKISMFFSKF